MKKLFIISMVFLLCPFVNGQNSRKVELNLLPGEKWWGGLVADGDKNPFGETFYEVDQLGYGKYNQSQPMLISNMGRYIWCDEPMKYSFKDNVLKAESGLAAIESGQTGNTLKEAYLYLSAKHFPPSGKIPDELMFTKPQYNTWIELLYNQNQKDILKYAHNIIDNGFPPGVLMIDDTWQTNYGVWEFNPARFSNPKAMMDELHQLGFKVMVWVCPFVSADSENFRKLREQGVLLLNSNNPKQPAIIDWWNGFSGVLDFTNPGAVKWFKGELNRLQKDYGVDGFKLDAGDPEFYTQNVQSMKPASPNKHAELYAQIGLDFPLNEYRACWKMGGQPLAQRLADKNFTWSDAQKLMPDMLLQGVLGYPFGCPDMIGGGEYRSFLVTTKIDQEMLVRSAQTHAMMPMMQFSVAPWRILDASHLAATRKAALLHEKMGRFILELAKQAAKTGEPIVRLMEYDFPHQGFEHVKDQFMLGAKFLVAPLVEAGKIQRTVQLPKGKWKDQTGKTWKGGQSVLMNSSLDELVWFEKLN